MIGPSGDTVNTRSHDLNGLGARWMKANSTTDAHLPTVLPVLPGLALSGRYLLTGDEPVNRGDTLGAWALPDDRVALMVADMVGHGDGAALASAQARSMLWVQLSQGAGLHEAMESLNRYAAQDPVLNAAALGAAVLDLTTGRLEYSVAGMLAPSVVPVGADPRPLEASPTRPLGMGGTMHVQQAHLDETDVLVLCTNGLTCGARRGTAAARNAVLSALAGALSEADPDLSPAQTVDLASRELMMRCLPAAGPDDDVALLVARRTPRTSDLSLELNAAMPELVQLRSALDEWLDRIGAGMVDHIGLGHALVELAANAVEHAYPPDLPTDRREVAVHVRLESDGTVRATVTDQGTWRLPEDPNGRGLALAGGLMERIDIRRTDHGTEVEVRTRVGRPVQMWECEEPTGQVERSDDFEAVAAFGALTASGAVDQVAAEEFHAAMQEATRSGTTSSRIDLNGVSLLSSPSVQTLLEFSERARQSGVELELVADPGSPARQVLDLVGLTPSA